MKRRCAYIPLSKQPLVFVLCQVRFSSIESMSEYIPKIQDGFRRQGYPNFESGKIQQFGLGGPSGIQAFERECWDFRNKESNTSIIVFRDSFVLQTTAYGKFEDFVEQLRLAAETILSKTEHDKYGRVLRIGLRYINLIQPKKGENFRRYLRPGFHGLSDEVFRAGTSRARVEYAGQTDVDDAAGIMVVRISQNDKGMDLPPDLDVSALKKTKRIQKGELVTLIDIDHYLEGDLDPEVDLIVRKSYVLHDHIIETFHDHVITSEAVEIWK